MSRIAISIKALKDERRVVARRLAGLDKLIGGFTGLSEGRQRRRRRATAKSKPSPTRADKSPRKRAGNSRKAAPAGNLAAATL